MKTPFRDMAHVTVLTTAPTEMLASVARKVSGLRAVEYKLISAQDAAVMSLRRGNRIEAQYREHSSWSPATVTAEENKGHLLVNFDGWDDEVKVPVTRARIISRKETSGEMQEDSDAGNGEEEALVHSDEYTSESDVNKAELFQKATKATKHFRLRLFYDRIKPDLSVISGFRSYIK